MRAAFTSRRARDAETTEAIERSQKEILGDAELDDATDGVPVSGTTPTRPGQARGFAVVTSRP